MDRRVAEQARELNRKTPRGAYSIAVVALVLSGCGGPAEARLRGTLARQTTGTIHLPGGVIELSSELQLARGAHDLEIIGSGTLLKATDKFRGRAILVAEDAHHIQFRDFSIDGNRAVLGIPREMAGSEHPFRAAYSNNGLWFDRVNGLAISNLHLDRIASFAILISRSSGITIRNVDVRESGSRNPRGRNNTTGGILLEEGSSNFEVSGCTFEDILGNALWTHSFSDSPRSAKGVFARNRFDSVGRDAIQVGHATQVQVEDNTGIRVGFPVEAVDIENQGTPVAVDTSGNVDLSTYVRNSFEDVDPEEIASISTAFTMAAVRDNRCINRGPAEQYPFSQFGIAMNDTDPGMLPVNVEISGNEINGARFGGLFLIGAGHRVIGNTLKNLNMAGCGESATRSGCVDMNKKDEPQLLQSGISLARGGARVVATRGNVIRKA